MSSRGKPLTLTACLRCSNELMHLSSQTGIATERGIVIAVIAIARARILTAAETAPGTVGETRSGSVTETGTGTVIETETAAAANRGSATAAATAAAAGIMAGTTAGTAAGIAGGTVTTARKVVAAPVLATGVICAHARSHNLSSLAAISNLAWLS